MTTAFLWGSTLHARCQTRFAARGGQFPILADPHRNGCRHGCNIARGIEKVGGDAVLIDQGKPYALLVRLPQWGWTTEGWGTADNNRQTSISPIAKHGGKERSEAATSRQRLAGVTVRVLALGAEARSR